MSLRIGSLSYQNQQPDPATIPVGDQQVNMDHQGYGFIQLSDTRWTSDNPQMIRSEQQAMVENNGLINNFSSYLKDNLQDHEFLRNNRFYPQKIGDTYLLRLTMNARTQVTNNMAIIKLMIPGLVQQDTKYFPLDIESDFKITVNYLVFCLGEFFRNGGGFYIRGESQMEIFNAGLLIMPVSKV